MGDVEIRLNCAHVSGRGVHRDVRHALLLVLMEAIRGQFVDLFRRHVGIAALNVALNAADGRHDTAGQRTWVTDSRRRCRDTLRRAAVELRALHSSRGLERCHHGWTVRRAIHRLHVEIRRMRALWRELLLVVELLLRRLRLRLLLLLSRLQHPLLLLKTISFPDDARVLGRRLHRDSWSCTSGRLNARLGHHFHCHCIRRHRTVDRDTSRHSLHRMMANLIDSSTRRQPSGDAVRRIPWHTRVGGIRRHTIRHANPLGVHDRLLTGHLTGALCYQACLQCFISYFPLEVGEVRPTRCWAIICWRYCSCLS